MIEKETKCGYARNRHTRQCTSWGSASTRVSTDEEASSSESVFAQATVSEPMRVAMMDESNEA